MFMGTHLFGSPCITELARLVSRAKITPV